MTPAVTASDSGALTPTDPENASNVRSTAAPNFALVCDSMAYRSYRPPIWSDAPPIPSPSSWKANTPNERESAAGVSAAGPVAA